MKNKSTLDLAKRLNAIMVEVDKLAIEYYTIVKELERRMPHLKGDENLKVVEKSGKSKLFKRL